MLVTPAWLGAAGFLPPAKAPTWTPADFASVTLVGFYDAEDNSKLTNVSGAASAWVDSANGSNSVTQGTSSSRPQIVASHTLTGRQVLQFDGSDDNLALAPCPYAVTGNLAMLVVGVQDALPADTGNRYAFSAGASTNTGQMLARAVSSGVNRFQTRTGNGAGGSNIGPTAAYPLDGRFIGIGHWASTTQQAVVNGAAGSQNVATMFGDTTRIRIGAGPGAAPSGFWNGAISAVLYTTGTMSAQDESNFTVWAAGRLGWR
jgi:hypothetical protein